MFGGILFDLWPDVISQIDNIEDQEDETSLFTIPAESDNSVFPAAPVMAFIEKEDMDLEAAIQRDTKMAELSKPQTLLENKSERKDTLLEPSKTEVEDFSDPLQSYLRSEDDTIFASNVSFREEKQVNQGFKKALKDVILSVSPYMKYSVPYLETEEGSKCKLRKYLPSELYWSESFNEKTEQKSKGKAPEKAQAQPDQNCHVKITSPHAFVMEKLTASLDDTKTQVATQSCTISNRPALKQQWFNPYSAGIYFSRQNLTESDVYRRQILTTKVYPRSVRIKNFIMAVDP